MTGLRNGRAPAAPPAGTAERSARRLRFSRRVVHCSLGAVPLMMLLFITVQVLVNASNGVAEGVLAAVGADRPWTAALAFVPAVPLAWLTLWLVGIRLGRSAARPEVVLHCSFALLLVLMALLDVGLWSLATASMWWSVAVLVATRRQAVGYSLVLLLVPAARLVFFPEPDPLLMAVIVFCSCFYAALFLVCNLAVLWLWEIAHEAVLAREAQARLAVSEERLRFARDMHDLVGHSLSGIAVKSELAARLAARDPERAAAEMASVQQVARDALREVRAAVSGYRDVDLAAEIASVRSVLTAVGARTTVAGEHVALPPDLRTLTAWVIREAATNVLRHSSARRCDITLTEQDRALVVEVYNDGVSSGADSRFGNGLTGLAERAAGAGGALSAAATDDGGFLLRAVLPVRAPAGAGLREAAA
ncbi:sensor histidine kinase [Actinorugispora endophytica]|uniref:Two-component system sensor histidine kinase DesK n=1 Tax=Actinorugispora endophytica TaxID=1605990 RepID=A0A4R6V7K7_9ACTN|nr:histidine kinase [Actinorugispora endophytica]TDQ55079.1 two-component system sensor histidine kinase DesK [Actinorugispora endophytica]